MNLLYTIFNFLIAVAVLVAVHECGHFAVARLCGVKVLRFSLGFGPVLWRGRDRLGTEFTLAALPLGGYVKMLDEREGPVAEELLAYTFNRQTLGRRFAIVLAGPAANFCLAILLFWALFLGGERGLIPIIGTVEPGSLAAQGGLEVGQEIIAVDKQETPIESALAQALLQRLGESGELELSIRYPDSALVYELSLPLDKWQKDALDPDPLAALGITIAPIKPIVGQLLPDKPAVQAGFQLNDRIISVNDEPITDWRDFQKRVKLFPGQELKVVVARDNAALTQDLVSLSLVPESFMEKGVSYGRVGMAPKPISEHYWRQYHYSLVGALAASAKRVWDTSGFVLLSVKKLILGEISTKNLSGPISIAKVAASSAQDGVKSFVGFVALLSVFLGVFNLLPIPVLDGGHLLFFSVEFIRGKPVSEKLQALSYQIGLMLVLGLSILAMYNDIMRL